MLKTVFKVTAMFFVLVVLLVVGLGWWFFSLPKADVSDLRGEVEYDSLEHDGLQRSWQAYLPSTLPARPALLLVLRGSWAVARVCPH